MLSKPAASAVLAMHITENHGIAATTIRFTMQKGSVRAAIWPTTTQIARK